MPLTVSNPRDLLLLELGDILFVERMLSFEVLPELLKQVNDPELAGALAEHLEQTKRHVANVEQAFRAAMARADGTCQHQHRAASLTDRASLLQARAGDRKGDRCL